MGVISSDAFIASESASCASMLSMPLLPFFLSWSFLLIYLCFRWRWKGFVRGSECITSFTILAFAVLPILKRVLRTLFKADFYIVKRGFSSMSFTLIAPESHLFTYKKIIGDVVYLYDNTANVYLKTSLARYLCEFAKGKTDTINVDIFYDFVVTVCAVTKQIEIKLKTKTNGYFLDDGFSLCGATDCSVFIEVPTLYLPTGLSSRLKEALFAVESITNYSLVFAFAESNSASASSSHGESSSPASEFAPVTFSTGESTRGNGVRPRS